MPSKKVEMEPIAHTQTTATGSTASTGDLVTLSEFPAAWFKQEQWRRHVIPTLCLWAAAQPDVWAISKEKIIGILKLVLPVAFPGPNFTQLPDQLTVWHKVVAVVRLFNICYQLLTTK